MAKEDACSGAVFVLQELDGALQDAPAPPDGTGARLHCAVVDLPLGERISLAAWTPDDLVARRELFLGMIGG